jgi:hypothetical protein
LGCYTKPVFSNPLYQWFTQWVWGANGICVNGAFELGTGERTVCRSSYPVVHDYARSYSINTNIPERRRRLLDCFSFSRLETWPRSSANGARHAARTTNRQSTWVPSRSIGQPIHAHYTARSDDLFRAKGGYFKDPSIGQRVESGQANSVVNQEAS